MKKNICVLVIALVLITLGVLDLIVVNKTFDTMYTKVNALELSISNDESQLKKQANEMADYWDKKQKTLTLFLYYRDIDTLGKQIDLVVALVQNDDLEKAKIEVIQLDYLLKNAAKVYQFTADNLL